MMADLYVQKQRNIGNLQWNSKKDSNSLKAK